MGSFDKAIKRIEEMVDEQIKGYDAQYNGVYNISASVLINNIRYYGAKLVKIENKEKEVLRFDIWWEYL